MSQLNIPAPGIADVGTLFAQTCIQEIKILGGQRDVSFEIFVVLAYISTRIAFALFKIVGGCFLCSSAKKVPQDYPAIRNHNIPGILVAAHTRAQERRRREQGHYHD